MTGGELGGPLPDWYVLIRAARYLGVTPWELDAQPTIWREWALAAEGAEDEAREAAQRAPVAD